MAEIDECALIERSAKHSLLPITKGTMCNTYPADSVGDQTRYRNRKFPEDINQTLVSRRKNETQCYAAHELYDVRMRSIARLSVRLPQPVWSVVGVVWPPVAPKRQRSKKASADENIEDISKPSDSITLAVALYWRGNGWAWGAQTRETLKPGGIRPLDEKLTPARTRPAMARFQTMPPLRVRDASF
jgi:hypothetical protein